MCLMPASLASAARCVGRHAQEQLPSDEACFRTPQWGGEAPQPPETPPELLALGSQQLELIAARLVIAPVVRVLSLELLGRQLDLPGPKHRPAV